MNPSSEILEIQNRVDTQRIFSEIGSLSTDELIKKYNTLAWGYINSTEEAAIEGSIQRLLQKESLAPLLDLGCGTGRLLIPLSKKIKATGLDFSQTFLDQLSKEAPEIPLVFGEATKLPFADESFQSILCVRLIQHLGPADHTKFFQECRRVLRPGGVLIVLNYNALSFLTVYKKLCQTAGNLWPHWPLRKWRWQIDDYHFAWELASLYKKNGFSIVEQSACTPAEPDLDRFLGIDAWMGRCCRPLQSVYYRVLSWFNPLGLYFPFSWLFSRVIVVGRKK